MKDFVTPGVLSVALTVIISFPLSANMYLKNTQNKKLTATWRKI